VDPTVPLTLETPRLVLRPFEERDCDSLHEMFGDAQCVQYTLERPLAHWETWRCLAAYVGRWQLRGYGPYAVVAKSTGSMIGPVGLWFPVEWPEPEIKWSLARRFWGEGFATEAAMAVRDMAFSVLRCTRLVSVIRPGNTRSKAVARRLGGHNEKTIPFRGGLANVYAYGLDRGVGPSAEASRLERATTTGTVGALLGVGPAVPPWVPAEAWPDVDFSELEADSPTLRAECARLGALLGANVAAYRRDAAGRPGGLCSRYRSMGLTVAQLHELKDAERRFPDVAFVAYRRPLERRG
jgi:RimJ/RimL family protein N-acetyltransferase